MFRFIKRCFRALKFRLTWIVFRLFPIDNRKIVVSSFYGRGYGDNAKYIVEKLLQFDEKLRIIWVVKSDDEKKTLPDGVEPCEINTWKNIYHLMTSKIWIDNCRKYFIMLKRKKQCYIQTWHGFALKRIEKDAIENLADNYEKLASRDSRNIDYIISCSRFMTNIYRNSFWYNGEIIEIGAPRNDIFCKDGSSIKKKVYEYYNINEHKKTVLYAPTFRADRNLEVYSIDYGRLKVVCEKRFGDEFCVLLRLHPNIAEKIKDMKLGDQTIDATYYPDMQELMVASDIIITDYSSVMFDFALTGRPCFQFAVDIDDYKKDRNFYFELDKLPFTVSKNNDELEKNILSFDSIEYEASLNDFYDNVGMVRNGNASEKCSKLILEKCLGVIK